MTTRRGFLAGAGAVVVGFALSRPVRAQEGQTRPSGSPPGRGSLEDAPFLDSWIRIDADGAVTVFTGKCELGQGLKTALVQIAAEELDVAFERVRLVTADTAATPDEGYTAGSNSLEDSGTAIRHAAALVRELLVERAAQRWDVARGGLRTGEGAVIAPDGRRLSYGALVAGMNLHVEAGGAAALKNPAAYRVMNRSRPRVDIPAKVTGAEAYVHDLRLPGMLHARVVRPPSYGAELEALDASGVERLPGVVKVVRERNFLAVVAEREWTAVKAMRALEAAARWREAPALPDAQRLPAFLVSQPSQTLVLVDTRSVAGATARRLEATYSRPYQMHASIGPSCAVAQWRGGVLHVWSHTQGVYPDRAAIAEMLGIDPGRVRVVHAEGAGCYGHNGADDAAADAALVATALEGRPVRVQWMREQEHAWEPYGPAMVSRVRAALDPGGRIVDWEYAVWSNTHSTRPGGARALLAARHGAKAFPEPQARPSRSQAGMGDRNAIPIYTLPSARVVHHFLPQMPVRVSALRSLGAYLNVFAIESFMDELAAAAGVDPVEFRLRHLEDERARDVIGVAARRFGWESGARATEGVGRGFGFARYKNAAAYCAVACEVRVEPETGRARLVRAVSAIDSGQVVNPDGLRNQVQGGILQAASWTLHERVRFDRTRIRSIDWSTYPILRFDGVPDDIEVHLVDRPGDPFLGSGEAAQGPAAAAVANAVAHATGRRLRDVPLALGRRMAG